jgi:hypothetical protein
MGGRIQKVVREVNGITIEQRSIDGFINGTAMCVAYDKEIASWFRNQDTLDLFVALALDLDPKFNHENSHGLDVPKLSGSKYSKIFVGLVISRPGAPETGGGTWLHPDLAVQLAQWCNKPFALQVSRWVREWMTSAYNPIQLEADADRVQLRDDLKDKKRLEFTDCIKAFLQKTNEYIPGSDGTKLEFVKAHDKLNKLLTTEKASEMRIRLEREVGKPISEKELLRDYFPINDLANYASLCQAAANEMVLNGTSPLAAIEVAAKQVLSPSYIAKPIDFTERINLVRRRLEQKDQLPLLSEDKK